MYEDLLNKKVIYQKQEYDVIAIRQVPKIYCGKEDYFVAEIKKENDINVVNCILLKLSEVKVNDKEITP